MGETLNKLGEGLRLIYRGSLEHPMNWHLIDAFAKLEEVKALEPDPAEQAVADGSEGEKNAHPDSAPDSNQKV